MCSLRVTLFAHPGTAENKLIMHVCTAGLYDLIGTQSKYHSKRLPSQSIVLRLLQKLAIICVNGPA